VNFASKVELQYNSLFDPHLQNFFTSEKRREHLKKIGLVCCNYPYKTFWEKASDFST